MTQLRFKSGVSVFGLQPEILWALDRCVDVWMFSGKDVTVTSARGGKHSTKSKHYSGMAVDLRTRDLTEEERNQILYSLPSTLGGNYDFILESDHFHLEYDPRNKYSYSTEQPFK